MNARRALAAALVALATAPVRAADLPRAARDDWRWVENENFRVLTNASNRSAEKLIDELERFRAALRKLLPRFELQAGPRVTVHLFSRQRDFLPYAPIGPDGRRRWIGGYFLPSQIDPRVAITVDRDDDASRSIYHGYFYLLLSNSLRQLPLWASTGLGELYSTFHYREKDGHAQVGRASAYVLKTLLEGPRIPIGRLLVVDRVDPEYLRQNLKSEYHARCWLLLHYLQIGQDAPPGAFASYFRNVAAGLEPLRAMETALGRSAAQIDHDLDVYYRKASIGVIGFDLGDLEVSPVTARRDATREEVLFELGSMLAHLDDAPAGLAEAHFAEAGRLAPDSAAQDLGAARLALEQRRFGEAFELYREAAAAEPDSFDAQLGAARAAMWSTGSSRTAEDEERLRAGRAAARAAARLDGSREDAWLVLGQIHGMSEPDDEALAELPLFERGLERRPGDTRLAEIVAHLYERAGRTDEARTLADATLAANPSAPLHNLEVLAARLDVEEARRLAEAGDVAAAEALLEARLASMGTSSARDFVDQSLTALRSQARARARWGTYERARKLVESRQLDEAIAELRTFLEEDPVADELHAAARELLDYAVTLRSQGR